MDSICVIFWGLLGRGLEPIEEDAMQMVEKGDLYHEVSRFKGELLCKKPRHTQLPA